MLNLIAMTDLDLSNKRLLIREDFNVPVKAGKITSDARIRAALPTIEHARKAGARVMLMSHLGRPTEGEFAEAFSLGPVARRLSELLLTPVPVIRDWRAGVQLNQGDVVLLENVRFNRGEEQDAGELARAYASLCDIFVMDAFGTAHRAQASTHGVARYAPVACAGPLLVGELQALAKALDKPERPMVAIVGGAKVSSKLTVLETLAQIADRIIVGGGIANTFLAAAGKPVGQSLCETELIPQARALMATTPIPIPIDVVVGTEFSPSARATLKDSGSLSDADIILDVGPRTSTMLAAIVAEAKTILWNGPVGVFEFDSFSQGTESLARAIAASSAFSIAGGGDTLAAIAKYKIADKISYQSTGGGAFLEYVEGKTLPAVAILEARANDQLKT